MLVNKTLCIGTKNKLLRKEVDAFVYGKIKESGLLHAVKAEAYETVFSINLKPLSKSKSTSWIYLWELI